MTDRAFWEMIRDLDCETVLCGPDRDPDDSIIDDIMASDFETALSHYRIDASITDLETFTRETLSGLEPIATEGACRIVIAKGADGYDYGVLAITADDRISGVFTGPTLCVDPDMEGQGIGRALVVSRMKIDEGLPTWEHDKPGYSNAGEAVILSALWVLQEEAGIHLAEPAADEGPEL